MSSEHTDYSRSTAILIGTSNYQDSSYLPLPAVTNSLNGLREVLTDSELCGWPADRIIEWRDPSDVRQILQKLRRIARDTEDVLLVYFVGHGTIVGRGQLCLVLADTEASDPDITGLEYERVRQALLDSPARTKIVILDCCYSGRAIEALSEGTIADSTDTRGVYTLTASDHAAHVVALAQQAEACTSFTGELLDLVRTGILDGPQYLPLNLIYLHLRRRLHTRRLPEPNQRGTDTAGEFVFTRNAAAFSVQEQAIPLSENTGAGRGYPADTIRVSGRMLHFGDEESFPLANISHLWAGEMPLKGKLATFYPFRKIIPLLLGIGVSAALAAWMAPGLGRALMITITVLAGVWIAYLMLVIYYRLRIREPYYEMVLETTGGQFRRVFCRDLDEARLFKQVISEAIEQSGVSVIQIEGDVVFGDREDDAMIVDNESSHPE
ncbi:caspase, EACC1-associated type [Acrocarpospora catenulata]|uniref:caspase, EACC1-associated type n=1 Tax=Acrocarpospora catenulata TaxID=2836182 RepID=UPI001BDACC1C|nr:DUF6232 family protein [Acrocarpospora catenulata]